MKSKEYTSRPEIPVSYKQSKPLDARKEEVAAIRSKFPNKIPLVIERHSKEKYLQALDKAKFLVPQEITLSAFVSVIRNRMTLKKSDALYILVENRNLVSNSLTMGELYRDYRDEDGFLYATYASQEAFG